MYLPTLFVTITTLAIFSHHHCAQAAPEACKIGLAAVLIRTKPYAIEYEGTVDEAVTPIAITFDINSGQARSEGEQITVKDAKDRMNAILGGVGRDNDALVVFKESKPVRHALYLTNIQKKTNPVSLNCDYLVK